MGVEITTEEKQAVAELMALLPLIREILRVLHPAALAKADMLLGSMSNDPQRLMTIVDGISTASDASANLQRLQPELEKLLTLADLAEVLADLAEEEKATRRLWARFGRISERVTAVTALWRVGLAGFLAALTFNPHGFREAVFRLFGLGPPPP